MINLFIVDYYNLFKTSGLATYVNLLNEQLENRDDIQLHFIWVKSDVRNGFTKNVSSHGVHYFIPGHIERNGFDQQAVEYLAKEIGEKENLLFHFNWINHCPFGYLLKKYLNCSILLTQHCTPWRELITKDYKTFLQINKGFSGEKSRFIVLPPVVLKELWSYQAMDHIICVSKSGQKSLNNLTGFPSEHTTVVYNGLNKIPNRFDKRFKSDLRKKYGIANDEVLILFAGAIVEKKGVFDLVKTFDKLVLQASHRKLRLIISGQGDYSGVIRASSGNWLKITLTGFLSKRQLYEFYTMADIGIVPSYIEPFGYSALEMMRLGLPIIVTHVDGLQEIVPDDCGLKVPVVLGKNRAYVHEKKLSEALLYFLNNPEIAQKYAARAQQHAKKNFTAKNMAYKTVEVYKKLIAGKRTSKPKIEGLKIERWPLVSVLLPCYNVERTLKACIDSILQQTYSNFELIIVNDGSIDTTADIIESYEDPRIRLINNETSCGITYSLNQGIKRAKGKYIARIEADAILHGERLQKQTWFLEDKRNKDVAMVGSNHFVIDNIGNLIGLKQYPISDAEIKIAILFQNPFLNSSVMIREHALKKIRYSKKYKYAEDYDLWIKLSQNNKLANLPEFLTYCRVYETNTSGEKTKEQQRNAAELISIELDKLGIEYTPNELALHIAVNAGYATRYFNNAKKIAELKVWLDKVLYALKAKYCYSNTFLQKSKTFVLQHYCGIHE